ncbi:MAG: site-specific integrase, partial [Caldisericia bacterium]|nr:site-specific integrase [Caldisericia bacterium]
MKEKINDFLLYMEKLKNSSKHTLRAYKRDLFDYYEYLKKNNLDYLNITRNSLRGLLVELKEKGLDKRSISRKISSIRSFYRFLLKEGLIEKNPVTTVELPKIDK